jgi:hypothetical protein
MRPTSLALFVQCQRHERGQYGSFGDLPCHHKNFGMTSGSRVGERRRCSLLTYTLITYSAICHEAQSVVGPCRKQEAITRTPWPGDSSDDDDNDDNGALSSPPASSLSVFLLLPLLGRPMIGVVRESALLRVGGWQQQQQQQHSTTAVVVVLHYGGFCSDARARPRRGLPTPSVAQPSDLAISLLHT